MCNRRLGLRNTTTIRVAVGLLGFLSAAVLVRPVGDSAAVGVAVRLVCARVTIVLYLFSDISLQIGSEQETVTYLGRHLDPRYRASLS